MKRTDTDFIILILNMVNSFLICTILIFNDFFVVMDKNDFILKILMPPIPLAFLLDYIEKMIVIKIKKMIADNKRAKETEKIIIELRRKKLCDYTK